MSQASQVGVTHIVWQGAAIHQVLCERAVRWNAHGKEERSLTNEFPTCLGCIDMLVHSATAIMVEVGWRIVAL